METPGNATALTALAAPAAPSKAAPHPQFVRRVWRAFSVALATIIATLEYAIIRTGSPPVEVNVENPPQPMLENLWQAACVMVLSYLAFEVHSLPARAHDFTWEKRAGRGAAAERGLLLTKYAALIAMFLLPATLFFVAMMGKYQAAVFTMALIAIYVAAEHFSGLSQQEILLADQRVIIRKLGLHVNSLENVFGLSHGKRRLYSAYKESSDPIRAIVKFFDIDAEWWGLVDGQDWTRYFDGGGEHTLYHSLLNSPCADALFVCDLKLPREDANADTRAEQFNNFIGMAWQWLVLTEVARVRAIAPAAPFSFDIRVATALPWFHVASGNVYQVMKGETPATSVIRDLTAATATASGGGMLRWAMEEILRAEYGSGSAEEYLCATFCWAAHENLSSDHELTDERIVEVLKKLGMGEWIDRKNSFLPRVPDDLKFESFCCAIVTKFFEHIRSHRPLAVSLSQAEREAIKNAKRDRMAPKRCSLGDLAREML